MISLARAALRPTSIIIAMLSILFACVVAPQHGRAAAADKKRMVAYLAPSLDISYWQWVAYGVQEKAKELNMDYVQYDAGDGPGRQMANIQTAITRGVDAVVIGPVSSTSVPPLLTLLKQHNIPVSFAGIGPPPDATDFTSAVTANNRQTGVKEGAYICQLAKKLGGNKIGMLSLPQDRENAQKYLSGAQESIKAGNCDIVQIIQTHGLTVREAVSETNDLLTAHPDIKGIYGMYDSAGTGAAEVLATRGLTGKIAVVTADGSPTTVGLLRQGKLQGIMIQQAVGQGVVGTEQVDNALNGKPVTKHIELAEPLVTPQNIDSADIQKALKLVYPPSAGSY
jgi:ribose transport system substrate-binding protein